MDRLQVVESERRGIGRQVSGLPAAAAGRSDRGSKLSADARPQVRGDPGFPGQDLEGAREERHRGELGGRDAVREVDRSAAPPPDRVVHGRKVVQDERGRVNVLDRDRHRERARGLRANELARRERDERTDAFPRRKDRVPHGVAEPLRAGRGRRQLTGERRLQPGPRRGRENPVLAHGNQIAASRRELSFREVAPPGPGPARR